MTLTTELTTRLGLRHPVVLAPMDYVADACLANAVSRAGGLGLLGGGYGESEWLTRQLDQLDSGSDARIGCGFITWSLARQPTLLDLVLERKPAAVFLSFGDPAPFAAAIKAAGVPLICQVGNLEHARRALDVGADVLAAQGGEAGGHGIGTRSTFTLVPDLVDLVDRRGFDALVLASGGVADGRGLAAALALGAQGVVVGTRLWASKEAAMSEQAHRRGVGLSGDDTIRQSVFDIVRGKDWPSEYTGRVLHNKFVDTWHGREKDLWVAVDSAREKFEIAVRDQDFETANLIVGEAIGLVHSIEPADAIVESMVTTAVAVLDRVRS
ncbi:NAD(P)H-dependent flavin oxidoreductase [Amycolatopsis sp. TRM77291]